MDAWYIIITGVGLVSILAHQAMGDLFTSMAHMKLLLKFEKDIAHVLVDGCKFIETEEGRLSTLTYLHDDVYNREVNELQKIKDILGRFRKERPAEIDLHFCAHPINAFNLVKDWYKLFSKVTGLKCKAYSRFMRRKKMRIPSLHDFDGAAKALLRLQRTYNLSTHDMAAGNIYGFSSQLSLTSEDMEFIGDAALSIGDFGLAAQWFTLSASNKEVANVDLYLKLAKAMEMIGDEDGLFDAFTKAEEEDSRNATITAQKWRMVNKFRALEDDREIERFNMMNWPHTTSQAKLDYESLCRGDYVRPPNVTKSLYCRYKKGILPYITYKEEIANLDPRISQFYDVISDKDAADVIKVNVQKLHRAFVGDVTVQQHSEERISELTWMYDFETYYDIKRLSNKVADVTGLDVTYRPQFSSAEGFQVVNYGMGGHYYLHTDYFSEDSRMNVHEYVRGSGDRLVTFLYYLSEIKAGGATVFPYVGVRVPPIKKAAAFWYNAKPSGEFDPKTHHAGCPVLLGEKWVTNKWIRELGQEFRRPCPLDKNAIWDV